MKKGILYLIRFFTCNQFCNMANLSSNSYTRNHPFLASIKERYSLCKSGSNKNTLHVVLDLKGSEIHYNVGDSIGILPQNDPELVEKTLQAMRACGDETVLDKHAEKAWQLRDFLTSRGNITEISRKLLSEICYRQPDAKKKSELEALFQDGHREILKEYLVKHHLWDILHEHPEVTFTLQELCNLLMPLLPRLYSISSAQQVVGDEVHLTVALLEYHSNGHYRRGVCTHYLSELAPLHRAVIPVYIQPHHGFTTPEDSTKSIIMIGPGTGVAPFRAFMQERLHIGATGKNWLFFGEQHRATEFFYEEFWQELVEKGKLSLEVAFSRDQSHKVYVQHRMLERGEEFYDWMEKGAYVYVCGDANQMAKDVELALFNIIQTHGKHDEVSAKQYLKSLRAEKRYLRDVY